jgi:hypothetical protein
MSNSPPLPAIFGGIFYALLIGYLVNSRAWGSASAVLVYGLALTLGAVYQKIGKGKSQ